MNEKKLFEAMEHLDDGYVEEAVAAPKKRTHLLRNSLLAAALIAALTLGGIGVFQMINRPDKESDFPIKEIQIGKPEGESAVIKPWEDMTGGERYSSFRFEGAEYSGGNIIPDGASYTDVLLGQVSVTGEDVYSGKTHEAQASVYTVKGVNPLCSLALRFEGDDNVYVYNNSLYYPETLSELVTDLHLENYLCFGYIYDDRSGDNIRYEYEEGDFLWQMLLADNLDAKAVERDQMDELYYAETQMSVSIDIPVLGYRNISIAVTENGYLTTNILNTAKMFYIGKEKVDAFVSYVEEHCNGYKIVYVTAGEPIPE